MGVRVNTNKSCPYSEMRGESMRKKLDRGITITPKRGRIAGPLAKVRPSLLPFADATGLSSYIYSIIRSFYESKALCLQ
jgi:hypothetical protein